MSHVPLIAEFARVEPCPNGCAIIVLSDAAGKPIVEAHFAPALAETIIAELRRAVAESAAMQRPPV